MSTHEIGKAVDGFLLPLSPAKARKKSFLKSFDITKQIQDNNSLQDHKADNQSQMSSANDGKWREYEH